MCLLVCVGLLRAHYTPLQRYMGYLCTRKAQYAPPRRNMHHGAQGRLYFLKNSVCVSALAMERLILRKWKLQFSLCLLPCTCLFSTESVICRLPSLFIFCGGTKHLRTPRTHTVFYILQHTLNQNVSVFTHHYLILSDKLIQFPHLPFFISFPAV